MVQTPVRVERQQSRADRVLLHNSRWEQFERLLCDLGAPRSAWLA